MKKFEIEVIRTSKIRQVYKTEISAESPREARRKIMSELRTNQTPPDAWETSNEGDALSSQTIIISQNPESQK